MTATKSLNLIVTRKLNSNGFDMIHFTKKLQFAGENVSTPSETRINPTADLWFPFKPVSKETDSPEYLAELIEIVGVILESHGQPHEVISAESTNGGKNANGSWNDWRLEVR